MRRDPFPAIHTAANEKAASNVRDGRDLRDRADTLLDDIDELLEPGAAQPRPTSTQTRTAA